MRNKILSLLLLIPFLAHAAGGTAATKLIGTNGTIYMDVGSNVLYFPTLTVSSLTYINASGNLAPLTLGSGLSLTGSTLSATGGGVTWPLISTDGTIDIGDAAPGVGTAINVNSDGSATLASGSLTISNTGILQAVQINYYSGSILADSYGHLFGNGASLDLSGNYGTFAGTANNANYASHDQLGNPIGASDYSGLGGTIDYANHAANADSATSAGSASFDQYGNYIGSSNYSGDGGTIDYANYATHATNDQYGNDIATTYAPLASPAFTAPPVLPGYTVASLPTGTIGMVAYVTDALAPTFGAPLVGGGSVVAKAFYNGTTWINE
jgi:hypothetical protein